MSTDGQGTKCRRKIYNRLSTVQERYMWTDGRATANSERR